MLRLATRDGGTIRLGPAGGGAAAHGLTMNLDFLFGYDDPYLNRARLAQGVSLAGTPTEYIEDFMDAGGYPTKMPSGATQVQYGSIAFPPQEILEGPLSAGQGNDLDWVITWEGASNDVTLFVSGSTVTSTLTQSNRREYTVTGDWNGNDWPLARIQFVTINEADPPKNVKLFRKSEESLVDAGEKFTPHFLAKLAGYKRIRFLNWSKGNDNAGIRWADRTLPTYLSARASRFIPGRFFGLATVNSSGTLTYSLPGESIASLTAGPIHFRITTGTANRTVNAISNAANARLTITAAAPARWVAGTKLAFNSTVTGMSSLAATEFTITNVVDSVTFDTDIDTSALGTFSGTTVVTEQPYLDLTEQGHGLMKLYSSSAGVVFTGAYPASANVNVQYDVVSQRLLAWPETNTSRIDGIFTGCAWEDCFDLCNELGADCWVTMPHLADADYLAQWAALARDRLNSGLTCWFEPPNEVWNFGSEFTQSNIYRLWTTQPVARGGFNSDPADDDLHLNDMYGKKAVQMMKAVTTAYASSGKLFKGVLGCRETTPANDTRRLHSPKWQEVEPLVWEDGRDYFDHFCIAGYRKGPENGSTNAWTAERAWRWRNGDATEKAAQIELYVNDRWHTASGNTANEDESVDASYATRWQAHETFATDEDMQMMFYEAQLETNETFIGSTGTYPNTSAEKREFLHAVCGSQIWANCWEDFFAKWLALPRVHSAAVYKFSASYGNAWGVFRPSPHGSPGNGGTSFYPLWVAKLNALKLL